MSKLNEDIFFLIFEELQDDSKSLFSCLMVNRLWCKTVVPVLWRNPWCYDINYSNKNYLFTIIASYLSDDTKKSLMRYGIQLPSFSCQSLLFDYLTFCKSINTDTVKSMTITFTGTSFAHKQYLLEQEFYRLFMKKFTELKYLNMKLIRHQIFYYLKSRLRLESLCELECNTSLDSSHFYGLAQLCQYIQKLIFINENPNDYHGIAKLIEVQKNLKYFEWKDDELLSYVVPGLDHYEEILFALEKNANIINHLNIDFICISRTSQKVLPKFHKLKTLRVSFYNFSEEQLKMCIYHDLKIIEIKYHELKAASIIIENSRGHIKKIILESYEVDEHVFIRNFDDDSLIFIRKVYEKCSSIEYLSLVFPPSKQHFNEFEKLLKICQNMKSLCFAIYMDRYLVSTKEVLENGKELLTLLVKSAPTNLREIRFPYDVGFSLDDLEEFLEKWRGRPALSILTRKGAIYKKENFVKLINKYKNNGVIKDFKYESFENVINMDFKI